MAKTQAEFENRANADDVAAKVVKLVTVRVLPQGDGKISTGEHNARGGDVLYEKGERFDVAEPIALGLEGRGLAEIVGDATPAPEKAKAKADA